MNFFSSSRFSYCAVLVCATLLNVAILTASDVTAPEGDLEELNDLFDSFSIKKEELIAPFDEQRANLLAKYIGAITGLLKEATDSANLDRAVRLREEIERLQKKNFVLEPLPTEASKELRTYRHIFETERDKIGVRELREMYTLHKALAEKVQELESSLTRETRIDDALVVRSFREKLEAAIASAGTSIASEPVSEANLLRLKQLKEKGGKLKVSGIFSPSISAVIPELEELPTDFVKVYAFRSCWIGLRANGASFVLTLNRERTEAVPSDDLGIKLVTKGFDPWVYTRDRTLHRLISWDLNYSTFLSSPVAVAGGHATGLMLGSRGKAELRDFISPGQVAIPDESLIKTVKDLYSTKHSFLVVDRENKGHAWDMRKGVEIPVSVLETSEVIKGDGGNSHYIILDQKGDVKVFDVSGGLGTMESVPSEAVGAIEVQAGGLMNAVQHGNGRWIAWGPSKVLVEQVPLIGPTLDLDLYYGEEAEFIIWIEPLESL